MNEVNGRNLTLTVAKRNAFCLRNFFYIRGIVNNDLLAYEMIYDVENVSDHCAIKLFCCSDLLGVTASNTENHTVIDYSLQSFDEMSDYNIFDFDWKLNYKQPHYELTRVELFNLHALLTESDSHIVETLQSWFTNEIIQVKRRESLSERVTLSSGVRQGGVLSPRLFPCYADCVLDKLQSSKFGCFIGKQCCKSLMYADDLIL